MYVDLIWKTSASRMEDYLWPTHAKNLIQCATFVLVRQYLPRPIMNIYMITLLNLYIQVKICSWTRQTSVNVCTLGGIATNAGQALVFHIFSFLLTQPEQLCLWTVFAEEWTTVKFHGLIQGLPPRAFLQLRHKQIQTLIFTFIYMNNTLFQQSFRNQDIEGNIEIDTV